MREGTSDPTKPVTVRISVGGTNFHSDGTIERIEEKEVTTKARPANGE